MPHTKKLPKTTHTPKPDALARARAGFVNQVVFWVNGKRVALQNPEPRLLLVDYLRSADVGLTGTKIGCKEGGCGACTVILSHWDRQSKNIVHNAINSCLRPVASLDGACITTIEGIGSTQTQLNEFQEKIAAGNGSQCGFCTPGFVMSRYCVELTEPDSGAQHIENNLDGNLCRCTGYYPIMRAFGACAPTQGPEPVVRERGELKPAAVEVKPPNTAALPYHATSRARDNAPTVPKEAIERAKNPQPLAFEGEFGRWFRATTLQQAFTLMLAAGKHGMYVQGNTSSGVLPRPFDPKAVFIDTSRIPELLYCEYDRKKGGIRIGGSVTIARLLDEIKLLLEEWKDDHTESLLAVRELLPLLGNSHIRNAGTVSGNLMLTKRQARTAAPFPSDLFTALCTVGATLSGRSAGSKQDQVFDLMKFIDAKLPPEFIVTGIWIPLGAKDEFCKVFKIARRRQNAHAVVNGGFRVLICNGTAAKEDITIIFGGVSNAPFRARKTEEFLAGKRWNQATLTGALHVLTDELKKCQVDVMIDGTTPVYRASLARSLFFKFFVHVALKVEPSEVSADVASAAADANVPLITGSEEFEVFPKEFPVSEPIVKLSAFAQASGEAQYTHDLPAPPRTLAGIFVQSTQAKATFTWKPSLDEVIATVKRKFCGIHDLLTVRDIPNPATNMNGIGGDDPIFAPGNVIYAGQPLGLVLAETELEGTAAAIYIQENCVVYKPQTPILTEKEALALPHHQGIFQQEPPTATFLTYFNKMERPGSDQEWLKHPDKPRPGMRVAHGRQRTGEQMHFYMETQAALAVPDASGMTVYSATQDLDTLQFVVAQVLGIPVSKVSVQVGLVGGGFGGKTTRVGFFAVPAALAANKHNRPVRVILSREADSKVMGKRHPIDGDYHVMFTAEGELKGYKTLNYADGGSTYDCTFFILDEMQTNGDGPYMVPTYLTEVYAYRTNKPSNTAMRSFGVTQVCMVRESAVEQVAHALGMLPEAVREKNLYRSGSSKEFDVTPYGEALKDCDIRGLWKLMMKKSDFHRRERKVREFNANNLWRKRGISMIPLKYGIAYTRRMLNQGRAIINVYHWDGSLTLMHGGVEIGQGIHTKMAQICAEALHVPLNLIQVSETSTRAIGNAISTGASTGADLNGVAVQKAGAQLRKRLEKFCRDLKQKHGEQFCVDNGIDYWNYKEGWLAQVTVKGSKTPGLMWANVASQAFNHRIDLTSEAFYKTPHLSQITPKHPIGQPYFYYTYGVSCSEVEIDVLTGESVVLRADVMYQNAKSLNPFLDIGQVQGAFVQCIGNMTSEQVLLDEGGRLISFGTWDYKPPTPASIPRDFRVSLLVCAPVTQQGADVVDKDALASKTDRGHVVGHTAAQSSRTVGEPPFVLGTSVFFALKHAVAAARADRGDTDWFDLDAPATVERIQQACLLKPDALKLQSELKRTAAAK